MTHPIADSLESGKMDNGVDLVFIEYFVKSLAVEHVGFVKFEVLARYLLYPVNDASLTVVEVVKYYDVITCLKQFDDGM